MVWVGWSRTVVLLEVGIVKTLVTSLSTDIIYAKKLDLELDLERVLVVFDALSISE